MTQPPTILIVDDADSRRQVIVELLKEKTFEVLEAADCEGALHLLSHHDVSLVLTETELPGKSGLYLLRQTREHQPDTEVILITHNASSYNLLQALRNGAYDFIVRPVDTGEILYNSVDRAISHIRLRQENAELISELEKNNRSLRRALKMMQALNSSIERLSAALDIEDLLTELLSSAMREISAQRGFLALYDRSTGELALKAGEGIDNNLCRQYAQRIPAGLSTEIARRGKPVLVGGALPERLSSMAPETERHDLLCPAGLMAAPLHLKEKIIGILVLSGCNERVFFGEQEMNFLIQLSHHATLALEKAGIIRRLQKGHSSNGSN